MEHDEPPLGSEHYRNLHTLLPFSLNSSRNISEEVVRPESEHLLILDEWRHVFTCLIDIKPVNGIEQQLTKPRAPMAENLMKLLISTAISALAHQVFINLP